MSIKNLKPSSKSGFKQGYYRLINESKYAGPRPIIYRSSYELKFATYCDQNENIIMWSSEPFKIKYFNLYDKRYHFYYPDFYIKIRQGIEIKDYIIEVKPSSHLIKPKIPLKKTKKSIKNYNYKLKTYITNASKIKALKIYAKKRGCGVMLLTEKHWII